MSFVISGEMMPQGTVLEEIIISFAYAIGYNYEMIKWNNQWVWETEGGWEIMYILLADPSGEYDYVPDDILMLYNYESCGWCYDDLLWQLQ